MNCQAFREHLHGYYLGSLSEAQRRELEAHAAGCDADGRLFAVCQELSCREFVEFLDDYVEGRLPPARREVFERHIAICSECTHYLDGYRSTLAAARRALASDATPDAGSAPLPEDLIRAILAARRV